MKLRERFRRWIPVRLRRLRGELLHALKRDEAYYENEERKAFFRRAFRALAFNGIHGDYVEFGCCGGETFGLAFRALRRAGLPCTLWAFDSFRGLPPQSGPEDRHPVWVEGDYSMSLEDFHRVCRSHGMTDSDYRVVPGFYKDSLVDTDPARLDRPGNIALAYIDCDLFTSTVEVLRFLADRLRHGMILAFDDYYCWSETAVSGERNACNEFFANHPLFRLVPYLQFGWHGMSFVVEDKVLLKRGNIVAH